MTYLLSKFTNRALSKTVAFGDGVFSIADFLRDPGERRDGVRTGGGDPPTAHPALGTSLGAVTWVTPGVPRRLGTGVLPPPHPEPGPLRLRLVPTCPAKHQHPAPGELLASVPSGCLWGLAKLCSLNPSHAFQ